MRRLSMATRDELLATVSERYKVSGRADKSRICDEFAAATENHGRDECGRGRMDAIVRVPPRADRGGARHGRKQPKTSNRAVRERHHWSYNSVPVSNRIYFVETAQECSDRLQLVAPSPHIYWGRY